MDNSFTPSRLIAARQRRGLTKSQLAREAGLTPKSISNYESGAPPSQAAISTLAKTLRYPVEFFFAPDLTLPTADSASFRSFSRMTAFQRDAALASGGIAFALSQWLDERFELPQPCVPDLAGLDPEAAAEWVRSSWDLGVLPIKNVTHLLESKGVRVFSLAEDTREVNAFSTWMNGVTPFVFLNTLKSSESSRFDAAHELGHLVLHRHGEPRGKEVEAEANAFASALLMPKTELQALAGRCNTLMDIIRLKKRWNVSAMALVYRLHKVGALTDWLYRSLCIELSSNGARSKEPESAQRETSLLLKKVLDSLKSQGIGLREVAADLFVPTDELHKLVFGLTSVALGADNDSPVRSSPKRGHLTVVK